MFEEINILYKDDNIVISTEGYGKIYFTIVRNQTCIRMNKDIFEMFIESIGKYKDVYGNYTVENTKNRNKQRFQ